MLVALVVVEHHSGFNRESNSVIVLKEEGGVEEEFIQNRTRVGRESERGGTSTLSRNAGLDQSADETHTPISRCLPSTCPCR